MDFHRLENQWFALQVKTRFESRCALILRSKGYDEYLPLRKSNPRPNESRVAIGGQPLFPGYVFCKLNANARGPVVTTPGVIRVVGYGGVPAAISDEEVSSIKSFVESGRPVYPWPNCHAGQHVRVTAGPLRGLEGSLVRTKSVDRLVVSITLLQRSAAVELDAASVVCALPKPCD